MTSTMRTWSGTTRAATPGPAMISGTCTDAS